MIPSCQIVHYFHASRPSPYRPSHRPSLTSRSSYPSLFKPLALVCFLVQVCLLCASVRPPPCIQLLMLDGATSFSKVPHTQFPQQSSNDSRRCSFCFFSVAFPRFPVSRSSEPFLCLSLLLRLLLWPRSTSLCGANLVSWVLHHRRPAAEWHICLFVCVRISVSPGSVPPLSLFSCVSAFAYVGVSLFARLCVCSCVLLLLTSCRCDRPSSSISRISPIRKCPRKETVEEKKALLFYRLCGLWRNAGKLCAIAERAQGTPFHHFAISPSIRNPLLPLAALPTLTHNHSHLHKHPLVLLAVSTESHLTQTDISIQSDGRCIHYPHRSAQSPRSPPPRHSPPAALYTSEFYQENRSALSP